MAARTCPFRAAAHALTDVHGQLSTGEDTSHNDVCDGVPPQTALPVLLATAHGRIVLWNNFAFGYASP